MVPLNSSDKAYSDNEEENFDKRKDKLLNVGFDGSDNEAYEEDS
jgi:hypothetical protein